MMTTLLLTKTIPNDEGEDSPTLPEGTSQDTEIVYLHGRRTQSHKGESIERKTRQTAWFMGRSTSSSVRQASICGVSFFSLTGWANWGELAPLWASISLVIN